MTVAIIPGTPRASAVKIERPTFNEFSCSGGLCFSNVYPLDGRAIWPLMDAVGNCFRHACCPVRRMVTQKPCRRSSRANRSHRAEGRHAPTCRPLLTCSIRGDRVNDSKIASSDYFLAMFAEPTDNSKASLKRPRAVHKSFHRLITRN